MVLIQRIVLTCFCAITILNSQSIQYPMTPKSDQVDTYFGTKVPDPYRWLENDTARNVRDWVEAENNVTFGYLQSIPFRNQIKDRLTKLWNYPRYTAPYRKGKNYFFNKNNGLQNQSVMYIQKGLDGTPEIFLDPNKLSTDGTVSLGETSFSTDGKYFAYGTSRSGSDWVEINIMDVRTKRLFPDHLQWVKFSGISWKGNGFFYSRYDAPPDTKTAYSKKNEYHKVYYHVMGTEQKKDILIYEDKKNPMRLMGIGVTEDERFLELSMTEGGKKGNALYFKDTKKGDKKFKPILTTFDDQIYIIDNISDKLLLYTNRNAKNGKVILFDPAKPEEKNWKDILPEKPEVLNNVTTTGGKIFATYMKDVADHVYVYDLNGTLENEIELPTIGNVSGFSGERSDKIVFYTLTSFIYPATIFEYDIASKKSTLYRKTEIDFHPEEYATKQVFYKSKDGTSIPMFIVHKKEIVLDGSNPTLLYGYGGFNISMQPNFSTSRLVWLEQGGVYAMANLRGGGEYGEQWHEAGMKLNKQNVFDDFAAAAEYLIAERYTSPAKLSIQGGSNGGLLVGAVMNQRPGLMKVALPAVGVMDMLRYHKFTIGWSWAPDYGTSDDSVQFNYLYKYSPVQNISEKTAYPATLVTTADHDDRVVPAHSFKFIATLQEKYHGNNPVLIRIETKAGHGGGKPTAKIIEEVADIYAFTFYNLGVTPKY